MAKILEDLPVILARILSRSPVVRVLAPDVVWWLTSPPRQERSKGANFHAQVSFRGHTRGGFNLPGCGTERRGLGTDRFGFELGFIADTWTIGKSGIGKPGIGKPGCRKPRRPGFRTGLDWFRFHYQSVRPGPASRFPRVGESAHPIFSLLPASRF